MTETDGVIDSSHPYLWTSLAMLALSVVAVVAIPQRRRAMLWSGCLCAPFALASVIFVPEYWQPSRVYSWIAGPEDFLFSFACGVLVWLVATASTQGRLSLVIVPGRVLRVYGAVTLFFVSITLAFRSLCGWPAMTSVLVAGLLLYAVLLYLRTDLAPVSATSGLVYGVAYTLFFSLAFAVFPDFAEQWNWKHLWGASVLRVPVEETAFALVFGACWPHAMAYAFDAERTSAARDTAIREDVSPTVP